jgi:hypothetical protein
MDEETIARVGITLVVAMIFATYSSAYGPLYILALAIFIIAVILITILSLADFLLFPLFTKMLKITTIPAKDYTIPKENEGVVKYVNGLYYATGYITANVYNYVFQAEQMTEGEDAEMAMGPDKWEKALMSIKFPFKFVAIGQAVDIQKYRDDLEGRRGYLEFQFSRSEGDAHTSSTVLDDLKRRMRVIQVRIDRLGAGERPLSSMMYIETTSVGITLNDSLTNLTQQVDQLQTVFNVFDLNLVRVVGREMYQLYKLNYYLPEMDRIISDFQFQK